MHGYAKSLLEKYEQQLDADAITQLERIERASFRLDQLVRDVLAYSKISQGKIELKPVALKPLIEDILYQNPEFQEARNCISIEQVTHVVIGHQAYLGQCISNLIANALKFIAPGTSPQVRIKSAVIGDKVCVTVSDNGIGIHPEHHDRIFRMFSRVYSEKEYLGTGIGLAIAKKAILRMSGEIGFASKSGQGSDFWFILPRASIK